LLTDCPISMAAAQDLAFLKNNPRFMTPNYEANLLATVGFRSLAADKGLSAAGLAIAWLLAQGDHVLPIPGTRSVSHFAELLQASNCTLTSGDLEEIESTLPIGWAHGDRYSEAQWIGPERYC
jgi:aryl-alcohol dehydrogenase-like predicted oxidoreductase